MHIARRALEAGAIDLRDEVLYLVSEVDVDLFELAAAAARRTRTPGAYRAALSLYGGELLPENRYEDWAEARRDGLADVRPRQQVAKAGHQQYFISAAPGALWLHMKTSRPLFSNVRLRRAVNYAIDRQALVAQGRRFQEVNPFNAGPPPTTTCPRSPSELPTFICTRSRSASTFK